MHKEKLALLGGTPVVQDPPFKELFGWPIIGKEDEEAALEVIRGNKFSGTDITEKLQEEFCAWLGCRYALAFTNGTMSLETAMFAIGLGRGDEIICPTKTYWASITPAYRFGAVPVFCNIDENFSLDPADLERCITPKTKAIVAVHYCGYPCDMDPIMEIARRHGIKVIEDVSHAQGGLYKGRRLGTIGDVGGMSLMSQKSFAAGELGMLITDDRTIYERAIAYAHYERNNAKYIENEALSPFFHCSLGGVKGRANQLCSAIARVQLKYYDQRCADIRTSLNQFWDLLEGLPGIYPVRVDERTGSNMAGWYHPIGGYRAEELHGLPVSRFCEALRAEGVISWEGANYCLHTHNVFQTADIYNAGTPTRIEFADRDVRADDAALAVSAARNCYTIPWFKHHDALTRQWIGVYAAAYRKVVENHEQLLQKDAVEAQGGHWFGFRNG